MYPPKGKPCPQNVHGSVYVGMGLMLACQTSELRLGDTVLRCGVAALGAPLGGITGVHCDHLPPGALSLGRQDAQEGPSSCIVDYLFKPDLAAAPLGS